MKILALKIAVFSLFIISGICGLVYEVAWSRYIALFIGSTAYSHIIVLATYMGGLALGALYWGRVSDKVSSQLRLYGLLEMGIGIYCFMFPAIMEFVGGMYITAASSMDGSSMQGGLLALKFMLSVFTLILPTFLMGGTLPLLTKYFCRTIENTGKDVAILYLINSLGAVIGSGLAGFFLIRWVGLDGAARFAASLNILVAVLALGLAKVIGVTRPETRAAKTGETQLQPFSTRAIRIAIVTAAVSGFVAMLYELTWIRLLSNILGSTTYSFTVMLIAFISGIALGSLIVSFVIKKIGNPVVFLATCQYGTAISMILSLPLYERLPYFLSKIAASIPNRPGEFPLFLTIEFLFCFILMLVPTTFSGMSLPVASRIATSDMRLLGKSIGGVFSINTIGSVAGVLITGLLLIPMLGVKSTLELGVLLNGLLGLIIFFSTPVSRRLRTVYALLFVVIAVGYRVLFPAWNENFLISGVFRTLFTATPPSYGEFKKLQNEGQKILWHKEGVNANVAIRESRYGDTVQKTLVINGKADASSVGDLPTQVLLGQIPLMLSPHAGGDALVIGLGSGVTCGSALCHPLRSLDCIEITSEVVECNSFFAEENYNFMADPRTKIHIEDAIAYLKTSRKKYDHIISEPSNPWIAGIGNLYSLEYFNLCKSRLREGGLVTQWFHTYDANNDIVKLVLRTMSKALPFVTIWKVSDADIIIVASADPLSIDIGAIERKMRNPRIAQDLARINMYDIPSLLSTQIMSARNNAFLYVPGEINTLKKPLLEFMAPVALFTHENITVLDSIDERFSFQDKNLWFSDYVSARPLSFENCLNIARNRGAWQIRDLGIAYSALAKCVTMRSLNDEAHFMLARVSQEMGLGDMAGRDAQIESRRMAAEAQPDDVSTLFEYMKALIDRYRVENSIVNQQSMDDAVALVKRCVELTGGSEERLHFILGSILTGAGRYAEAADVFKELLRRREAGEKGSAQLSLKELYYKIGESLYNAGDCAGAEEYGKRAQSLDPGNSDVAILLKKIPQKKIGLR